MKLFKVTITKTDGEVIQAEYEAVNAWQAATVQGFFEAYENPFDGGFDIRARIRGDEVDGTELIGHAVVEEIQK